MAWSLLGHERVTYLPADVRTNSRASHLGAHRGGARVVSPRLYVRSMIPAKGTKLAGPHGVDSIEIGDRLGNGNFGEVFRAVDLTNGRLLAIKFARETLLGSVGAAQELAFKSDLLAAGKVKHPNVVDVIWVSESSTPPYLVMEHIDGGTLQKELRKRAANRDHLAPAQLKLWFEQIVDGMAAINAVVLHRDIKPDNILIDAGQLKITDFGLAKLVDAATRSQSFKDVGAVAYLAPEAWRSETNRIQRDMYAVGLTLFEIATLDYALPVPAERKPDLWKDVHMFGRPKRLGDSRSDLPPGLEYVLRKLMEKRPEDRYASWADVRTALNAAWAISGTTKQATTSAERIVRAVADERAIHQETLSAAQHAEQRMRDIRRAAEYRWNELLDQVQSHLGELEKLGTVSLERTGGFLVLRIDGKTIADAQLTYLPESHKFRDGQLANAVAVFTTVCGLGFNVILKRTSEEDAYGSWLAVGWRRNYVFFGAVEDRPEPFALKGDELARYIKVVEGMTSHLKIDHIGDVSEAFLRVIAECLESRRESRRSR